MTDRHTAYIVTLDAPIREDDAEATLAALRQIKGVIDVRPMITQPHTLAGAVNMSAACQWPKCNNYTAPCRRNCFSTPTPPTEQEITLAMAAHVILGAMEGAQIDMKILRMFFNGEPRAALTALRREYHDDH